MLKTNKFYSPLGEVFVAANVSSLARLTAFARFGVAATTTHQVSTAQQIWRDFAPNVYIGISETMGGGRPTCDEEDHRQDLPS